MRVKTIAEEFSFVIYLTKLKHWFIVIYRFLLHIILIFSTFFCVFVFAFNAYFDSFISSPYSFSLNFLFPIFPISPSVFFFLLSDDTLADTYVPFELIIDILTFIWRTLITSRSWRLYIPCVLIRHPLHCQVVITDDAQVNHLRTSCVFSFCAQVHANYWRFGVVLQIFTF